MRRRVSTDDSFDMFLDTITNTFGGVLLITLLIVLMVKQTSEAARGNASVDLTKPSAQLVQSKIRSLEAQKELATQASAASAIMLDTFTSEETRKVADEIGEQTVATRKMALELEQVEKELFNVREATARAQQQRKIETEAIAVKRKTLNRLQQQLESEQQKRVRSIPLPKEKETSKSSAAFFLDNGELYQLFDSTGSVNRRHFSRGRAEGDFNDDGVVWNVRKNNGIKLDPENLTKAFREFNAKRFYLTFVVRPNSFSKFAAVRSQCVASGFEYRIIASDGAIFLGGSGSAKTQ